MKRISLLALLACACPRTGSSELVGKWTAAGSTGDPMHGWVANYEFKSNGTFTMNGYPPIEVSGRWEVLEKAPGKLRVKLSKQKMKSPGADVADWADTEGWGDLSSDGRSFNFDGKQMNRQDPAPEAK